MKNRAILPLLVILALSLATPAAATVVVSVPAASQTGPSADVLVPVTVEPADGVQSVSLRLLYDPAVLAVAGAYPTPFTAGARVTAVDQAAGDLRVTLTGASGLSGAGEVVWVVFHAIGAAGSSSALTLLEHDLNQGQISSTASDGIVTSVPGPSVISAPGTANGAPGWTVDVPVVATPADGYQAVAISMRWNPLMLQALAIETTPLTQGCALASDFGTPGQAQVSLFSPSPLSGSGPILTVRFLVTGSLGEQTPIDLNWGSVNGGLIPVVLSDGLFSICADADGDGWTVCGGDCNDNNPNVHPGAPEICDGIDNQCPGDTGYGEVDEGPPACSDHDACTTNDICVSGQCVGGVPPNCDDGSPCTVDTCDPATGCRNTPKDCSDGIPCTVDTCDPATGACLHAPKVCDDGTSCTDDACDPATGQCIFTPNDANTCSDGNACTVDQCVGGACQCPPYAACASDTATFTNATDVPVPDLGVATSTITVSGAGPWLTGVNARTFIRHTWNQDLDVTLTSPAGTVVTLTSDNGGSLDDVFNGTVWDDNADPGNQVPFPGDNFAASRLVTSHTFVDGVASSPLAPEEALGAFVGENPNGVWTLTISDDSAGDSGSLGGWSLEVTTLPASPARTTLTFANTTPLDLPPGGAVATSTLVVTGPPNKIGSLVLVTGIQHTRSQDLDITLMSPSGKVETIVSGNGGTLANVFDGTEWNDRADPGNQVPFPGAVFPASHLVSDHQYTASTTATPLVPREALAAMAGDDANGVWTLSIVNRSLTVAGTLSGWSLAVTTDDCTPPCTLNCDDGNPCTDDSCDPAGGCAHTPNANPCDDGNACTTGDVCAAGACAGAPVLCDDGNPCTNDACDPVSGQCVFTVDDAGVCNDGNACTQGDSCHGGVCTCAATACAVTASTYTSADVPKAISEIGTPTITSTLTVNGAEPFLAGVRVKTYITHTYNNDLQVTLMSPAGTIVTLTSNNGGGLTDVFNGTMWDVKADPGNHAPFPGTPFAASNLVTNHLYTDGVTATPLAPEESLGAFDGENPNGVWTLTVADTSNLDGGSLDGWQVELSTLPAPPTTESRAYNNATTVTIPADAPATVTSTIDVAGLAAPIGRVRVTTSISHPANGELDVTLKSPAGRVVTLTSANGGTKASIFMGTVWDDAVNPLGQVPYAQTGGNYGLVTDHPFVNGTVATPLVPQEGLAAFEGETPNGTWTLTVSDRAAGNGGDLDGWNLEITTVSCGSCALDCDDGNPCTDDSCDPVQGCVHVNNTAPCNDGDACTQTDACLNGACTGSNPVVCTASDGCHAAGVCNPVNGQCSDPVAPDGTACNDGNGCTQTDTCHGGTCTGSNPVTCTALDQCHEAGSCDPATGQCSSPTAANGTACDDGSACTRTDACLNGACTGSNPIVCTAADQCHAAGTCNPSTGQCSNPAAPNGTACTDGNACTQTDQCESGVCTGSNPVACTALDQCHEAGSCNPVNGQCSNPAAPNGTTCSDGNGCTQTDQCESGVCTGSNPVVCTALDQCHVAGTCNASTGQCSNPAAPNGTACSDGSACTQTDACQGGTCTGSNPVVCTASDQCHIAGTCNPASGQCSNPAAPNGTACSDGSACTQTDTCQSGTCTGSNPVVCTAQDQCHVAGTCNPANGQCSDPAAPDGAACNDGNACTQTDTCQSGTCTGSNPVVCTALDQCHVAGTCNTSTGQCTNPTKANGTACSDGSACTQTDTCQSGTCTGSNPVVCAALDQCHVAGTCNASTGQCSNPAATNGTACSDGNACTQTDTCQSGTCTGSNPVVCTASDQCHVAGTCNASTGECTNPVAANGTACSDGNACTTGDACQSGACAGGPAPNCDDGSPCTIDSCVPATGCVHTFPDVDGDGTSDLCDLTVSSPVPEQVVDCTSDTPPAIEWLAHNYDRFRVYVSSAPNFPLATRKTSGDTLLTSTGWTMSSTKWKSVCKWTGTDLYIKVLGKDTHLPASDPTQTIYSGVVHVIRRK